MYTIIHASVPSTGSLFGYTYPFSKCGDGNAFVARKRVPLYPLGDDQSNNEMKLNNNRFLKIEWWISYRKPPFQIQNNCSSNKWLFLFHIGNLRPQTWPLSALWRGISCANHWEHAIRKGSRRSNEWNHAKISWIDSDFGSSPWTLCLGRNMAKS